MATTRQLCAAFALATTLPVAAANTCGIERAILSGSELTILFEKNANYFYNIQLEDSAGRLLPESGTSWEPIAVGGNGVVVYVKERDIQRLPYLRAPFNHVLHLFDHHLGCTARVTDDSQKLRVEFSGGVPGSRSTLSTVREIPIELPNR